MGGITSEDFRMNLAGSNAATPDDDDVRPIIVCRATLGNVLYTAEKNPDRSQLERSCGYNSKDPGEYHCIVGDREKCSGTYREFIVFNDDLVYPAYIVLYKREL